jgi:hypothetical protein
MPTVDAKAEEQAVPGAAVESSPPVPAASTATVQPSSAAPPPPARAAASSVPARSSAARSAESKSAELRDWDPNADEENPAAKGPPPVGRYHDGLYARFSLGGGYFSSGLQTTGFSADISGGSLGIDGMIGGCLIPGFAIGVAGVIDRVFSPSVTSGSASGTLDYDVVFGTFAGFIDAFPNPRGGFHAGGLLGFSYAYLSSTQGESTTATGFSGGGFVGYDAWMGKGLALGLLARLTAASLSDSESSGSPASTLSPVSFVVAATVLKN